MPTAGRYAVVPPAFHGLLLQDDRFVASGALPADQRLLSGQLGEAAGFAILKSNNARGVDDPGPPITPTPHVVAGDPMAVSYAEQINKVEAFRPDARFRRRRQAPIAESDSAVKAVELVVATGFGQGGRDFVEGYTVFFHASHMPRSGYRRVADEPFGEIRG